MIRPMGSATLSSPATSCQQMSHVVCAAPLVGKSCVMALGQNARNRVIASAVLLLVICVVATCPLVAWPAAQDSNAHASAVISMQVRHKECRFISALLYAVRRRRA